jgi:hypothetical protein
LSGKLSRITIPETKNVIVILGQALVVFGEDPSKVGRSVQQILRFIGHVFRKNRPTYYG